VVCSHRHETGRTAEAEAPEVAVFQLPALNGTAIFARDIHFNSFEFGLLRLVSCLEDGKSSAPDRMLSNVTMATSFKLRPPTLIETVISFTCYFCVGNTQYIVSRQKEILHINTSLYVVFLFMFCCVKEMFL
jgi:hypothetical protein